MVVLNICIEFVSRLADNKESRSHRSAVFQHMTDDDDDDDDEKSADDVITDEDGARCNESRLVN